MAQPRETKEMAPPGEVVDYRQLPLLELARRIAFQSDRIALNELHANRALFHYEADMSLVMAAFLLRLKESSLARKWAGGDVMVLEDAYDLTVDKFSNLPRVDSDKGGPSRERYGPDCRYYYKAFYDHTAARLCLNERCKSGMQMELIAATNLQGLVTRHFFLSCIETRRRVQRLVRRYFWQHDGNSVAISMPSVLSGQQCQRWLETNVPDYDPRRVGERERVQCIVNTRLTRPRMIPLDRVSGGADEVAAPQDSVSSLIEAEISIHGLAQTVAEDKADNIDCQRRAIKVLGKERLRQLVLGVFESVVNSESRANELAETFGLSPATLSRFAGSQWNRGEAGVTKREPPDLWKNAARLLAHHTGFVEAADKAGLLNRPRQTTEHRIPPTYRGDHHG
jgi:hypothetical protein